jgi:hypothetical protein
VLWLLIVCFQCSNIIIRCYRDCYRLIFSLFGIGTIPIAASSKASSALSVYSPSCKLRMIPMAMDATKGMGEKAIYIGRYTIQDNKR